MTEPDKEIFTPAFENMPAGYTASLALTFGFVWRMTQMNGRVCNASHEKIAESTYTEKRTVIRNLQRLVSDGLIIDHTPDLRNRPHTYTVSEFGLTFCKQKPQNGVTKSHSAMTKSHTETQNGVTKSQDGVTFCQDGMTKCPPSSDKMSHEDTDTLKDSIRDSSKTPPHPVYFPDDYSEALHVFSEATGMMMFPGGPDKAQAIAAQLNAAVKQFGLEMAVDLSKQAYASWVGRKNKEGRPYSRTGIGWIEWVLSNDIPAAQSEITMKIESGGFYA